MWGKKMTIFFVPGNHDFSSISTLVFFLPDVFWCFVCSLTFSFDHLLLPLAQFLQLFRFCVTVFVFLWASWLQLLEVPLQDRLLLFLTRCRCSWKHFFCLIPILHFLLQMFGFYFTSRSPSPAPLSPFLSTVTSKKGMMTQTSIQNQYPFFSPFIDNIS